MSFEFLENSLKSVEAVIFDLDGTLYDFKGLPRRLVLNAPFQMFKIRAEREARKSLKGRDLKNKAEWQQKFFELIAQFAKIPFEKAKSARSQRYSETSFITSAYFVFFCIVKGIPLLCIKITGIFDSEKAQAL